MPAIPTAAAAAYKMAVEYLVAFAPLTMVIHGQTWQFYLHQILDIRNKVMATSGSSLRIAEADSEIESTERWHR